MSVPFAGKTFKTGVPQVITNSHTFLRGLISPSAPIHSFSVTVMYVASSLSKIDSSPNGLKNSITSLLSFRLIIIFLARSDKLQGVSLMLF
jgi:hypothetical protein